MGTINGIDANAPAAPGNEANAPGGEGQGEIPTELLVQGAIGPAASIFGQLLANTKRQIKEAQSE